MPDLVVEDCDLDADELIRRYYRWWKVFTWRNNNNIGIKLGPLTIAWYRWDGWQFCFTACGRWNLIDTGLRAHRR